MIRIPFTARQALRSKAERDPIVRQSLSKVLCRSGTITTLGQREVKQRIGDKSKPREESRVSETGSL